MEPCTLNEDKFVSRQGAIEFNIRRQSWIIYMLATRYHNKETGPEQSTIGNEIDLCENSKLQ
jgi:hypothetical protein